MRVAIIVSHPIQYYSPWFRHLAAAMDCAPSDERRVTSDKFSEKPEDEQLDSLHDTSNSQRNALRVFYLWDFGVTEKTDKGFGKAVKWDVDLLDGYDHEFVPNISQHPGTDWFGGLDNPDLLHRVKDFAPDAVLQFGYNYKSLVNFDLRWDARRAPLLFRGDSHLLAEDREQSWQSSVVSRRQKQIKRWLRKIGLRLLFKRFACFLAVGKANADYFRAHGVPERKIVRCPHVVDNAFFLERKNASIQFSVGSNQPEQKSRGLREELGIPEDKLVFLFAGKLEEKKQPMQLLEAFLAADLPKATLLFVGSGELEGALKKRVALDQETKRQPSLRDGLPSNQPIKDQKTAGRSDHGTNGVNTDEKTEDCQLRAANSRGNVVFLDFQNQSAMPAVYRTGDVLVLPSKGRYETWGLAVNEAACCGLPAIVSSHVGCGPDLIEEGATGWVFAAGDVEDLRRCLCEAANNRERLGHMGSTLQRRVLGDFSYEFATGALLRAVNSR